MNISINVCRAVTKLLTDIVKEGNEKIKSTNKNISEILRKTEIRDDDVEKFTFYMNLMHNIQTDMYTANLILDKIDLIEEIKAEGLVLDSTELIKAIEEKKLEENHTES